MQQYVAGVFALVYLGMLFGGLPGLALNRTALALLGAIALLALSSTLAGNLFLLGSIASSACTSLGAGTCAWACP